MSWPDAPLSGTVDCVLPFLGPGLASDAARARVQGIAAALPAALTRWFYLEPRLRGAGDRLDLIVRVDAAGRAPLQALCADHTGADPTDDVWRAIGRFACEWARRGSGANASVDAVWLEFDLEAGPRADDGAPEGAVAPTTPAPRVFVDLTKSAYERGTAAARVARLRAAVAPLFAAADFGAWESCLVDALAGGGRMPYAGLVLGGPTAGTLRACLVGVDNARLRVVLDRAGWTRGEMDATIGTLDTSGFTRGGVAAVPSLMQIDLPTAREQPARRLGVEYVLDRRPQIHGRVSESDWLDALVARGSCDPAQRRDLDAWPGCRLEALRHEFWSSVVMRRLNHVKAVIGPHGVDEVKAYLCAAHGFYTRRDRRPALPGRASPPLA